MKKITDIDETAALISYYEVSFKIGRIAEEDKRLSVLGALHDLYEQAQRDERAKNIPVDTKSDAGNITK